MKWLTGRSNTERPLLIGVWAERPVGMQKGVPRADAADFAFAALYTNATELQNKGSRLEMTDALGPQETLTAGAVKLSSHFVYIHKS